MTTTIKGNLVMDKDLEYEDDLIVEGSILGKGGSRYNLKVTSNITASDITASNITARNITARNITAWDITAWDINASNITASNITANDITARDISYYAVCFAYNNIRCNSINGRRNNARHFVLDGKIEITK